MIPFAEGISVWGAATFISAVIGIVLVVLVAGTVRTRYLSAFAFGIFLWFFVDTFEGSSDLVVGEGFGGGASQFIVVLLFALGVVLFLSSDRSLLSNEGSYLPRMVPFLAALALGLHGLGEGAAFGATAAQTPSSSLLAAFGGATEGAAYALHKVLEPIMVGALYVACLKNSPRSAQGTARDVALLAFLFVLPSVVGAAAGYFYSPDTTYFFAFGAGASVYAAFRLTRQASGDAPTGRREGVLLSLAFISGLILIYLAALLHS